MVFYKYTINKMFRSVSTYITGIFGVLPILILGILAMACNIGTGYEYTSLITLVSFPLFVVFITFKTIQVFRNEIENQTMLTIVSKPFPRKKLVLEGLLALLTMIALLAFIGIFIPMLGYLRTESNIGEVFTKDILVTLTTILLGSIVASLGLLLSLKMKGKSFIGLMLAIFGIAFYAFWGTMTGLRAYSSRGSKLQNYRLAVDISGSDADGSYDRIQTNGKWMTYTFQGSSYSTDPTKDLDRIYNELQHLPDFKAMDFVKWIDPTLHWQVLYNGAAPIKVNDNGGIFSTITSGGEVAVEVRDARKNADGSFTIEIKATPESAVPIYYPIILWLIIGGVVVGLTFRTLNKANIS